jgi:hypothetical protein
MIIDERTEFCDATALNTGGAATYNVGDVIDTKSATTDPNTLKDLGAAGDLWLIVRVATTATSGGSATGTFRLVSDAVATPDTSTATVHVTSATIPVASLTAGTTILAVPLPSGSYERYLGIQQITATAAFTAGAIDAFLTADPAIWRPYADNVS